MIRRIDKLVGWLSEGASDRTDGFLAGALVWIVLAGLITVPGALIVALLVNLIVWREETRGRP